MKIALPILTLALLPVLSPGEPQKTPPIAYISLQQIASQATEAKAATARLDSLRLERAREIAAKERDLEATRLKIANAGGVFQGSARSELQQQEQRERTEVQQLTQKAQADYQALQRELQTTMRKKVSVILDDIARQRGLQVVLNEENAVMWAQPGADLTAEVVARLNAGH
jgi:Skp family chaperone for outer membrane proteins